MHKGSLKFLKEVLSGNILWSSYFLSFRFSNIRTPDKYNSIQNLFLFSQNGKEFLFGLKVLHSISKSTSFIIIKDSSGKKYKVDRYCPHQGADLKHAQICGTYLICPKHNWKFNLSKGGICKDSGETINAKKYDEVKKNS